MYMGVSITSFHLKKHNSYTFVRFPVLRRLDCQQPKDQMSRDFRNHALLINKENYKYFRFKIPNIILY